MNNFDFAIERVFRFFQEEERSFECYVVQIAIEKNQIKNGYYSFEIIDNVTGNNIYEIELLFNVSEMKVTEHNSHEDPLIETNEHYLVCLQLSSDLIKKLNKDVTVSFKDKYNNILASQTINNLNFIFSHVDLNKTYSHIVKDYYLVTDKDCLFRIHVGNRNGNYHEEEIILKANEEFYFKEYLIDNSYIGLQCSYENEITELEEKYIIIGQKGIINSHDILVGKEIYEPLLPFISKYKVLMTDLNTLDIQENIKMQYVSVIDTKPKEVKTILELLEYLNDKEIKFFETNIEFVKNQYKIKRTYGLQNTYNADQNKIMHIDTDLCRECKYNSKCVQVVPSGLSYKLLKQNISLECPEDCKIFKFINNKLSADKYDI